MSAIPVHHRDESIESASDEDAPLLELIDESGVYVSIGDVVAGKYRVEQVLGVGGMAFVLSARHVELGERFALKFLGQQFLGDPDLIERFTHEARAACRLRSEHITRVYDVGIHDGAPFMVMEHLHGRDLSTVVAESGPLAMADAVEYAMQTCEALAAAHRHGIVHRDIKPENLFLVESDGLVSIKLLDFGISKVALAGGEPVSRLTGQLTLGTPCYMSPEQIRSSAAADSRSDLWSLGVVLYELLAGTEAFRAPSITEVCAAVLERDPQPLEELRPDIPTELARVVARCLEKDPNDRYANVAELAGALLPFAPTRALVSAERASSLMRGVATPMENMRISAVRSAVQTGRHRSSNGRMPFSVTGAPLSGAPVAVDAVDAASPTKGRRSMTTIAIAFAFAAVAAVVAYPLGRRAEPASAHAPPPATIALESRVAAAPTPAATTPIAIHAAAATEPKASASSSAAKRFIPPAAPKPRVAVASASAVVQDAPKAPAAVATPAPAATPSVELGY